MTGRCGSTVLSKAFDWLEIAQSASEPDILGDIHELLERKVISREDAVALLRASLLFLIHRLRLDCLSRQIVVIKPRSLTGVWRVCELLGEALPGCKQIFQWRRVDNVVASFDAAVCAGMTSPLTRALHDLGCDGWLWRGVKGFMEHLANEITLAGGNEVGSRDENISARLNPDHFASEGALGFLALEVIFAFHIAKRLAAQGIWRCTLSYEELMTGRSAVVRELLSELGWLYDPAAVSPAAAAALGTKAADDVFDTDAHAAGGLAKLGGSSTFIRLGPSEAPPPLRDPCYFPDKIAHPPTEHLSKRRALRLKKLLAKHGPLSKAGYDLDCGCGIKARTQV